MRHTDFFIGVIVGIGAALLFARCPGSTGAANGKREGGRTIAPEPSIWSERPA